MDIHFLKRKGKTRKCPHCMSELKYSWLSGFNEGYISAFSKDGRSVLATQKLDQSVSEKQLEKAIFDYESERKLDLDYNFSIRNEMRCIKCNEALTSRGELEFEKLKIGKLFYTDGMTYVDDNEIYKIKII